MFPHPLGANAQNTYGMDAAPQVQAGPPTELGSLETALVERAAYLWETAGTIGRALDRLYGVRPEAESAQPKAVPNGQIERLRNALAEITEASERIAEHAKRIDGLA